METLITSLRPHHVIAIGHASDVAVARRAGQSLAQDLGFDEVRAGQLALLISEAATNIIKHAGDGRLFLSATTDGLRRGVDVVAVDAGPGIANLSRALRDGVSSAGTAGTGLGAMRRIADDFDVFAPRGQGAVFFMRLWSVAPPNRLGETADDDQIAHASADPSTDPANVAACQFGGLSLPIAGEESNGDGWAMAVNDDGVVLLAVDGLGHGPLAASAAIAAIECMTEAPFRTPLAQLEACHGALRATRGAALAVASVAAGTVRYAGIGNIATCLVDADTDDNGGGGDGRAAVKRARRQLISHNGIVGHNMRKLQEFSLPCPAGSLLVLHSDGLSANWDIDAYPGLASRHPLMIAGVLLRDFGRARDDASVVVLRTPPVGGGDTSASGRC